MCPLKKLFMGLLIVNICFVGSVFGNFPLHDGHYGVASLYKEPNAYKNMLKRAESGDVKAQLNLGDLFYLGNNVTRNITYALQWWMEAAQNQDEINKSLVAKACFRLASCDFGLDRFNKKEKIQWLKRAAKLGHPEAEFTLTMLWQDINNEGSRNDGN